MEPFLLKKANLRKLLPFYLARKEHIKSKFISNLLKKEKTAYLRYILHHDEGRPRISIYTNNFAEALRGDMEVWLTDLEQAGYIRATQGFPLEDVWDFTSAFADALSCSIKEFNSPLRDDIEKINGDDVIFLHELLNYSNYRLSLCYLRRRDEIINCRRDQLFNLHKYAVRIVSIYNEAKIWDYARQAIIDIFGLQGEYFFREKLDIIDDWALDSLGVSDSGLRNFFRGDVRNNQYHAIDEYDNLVQITQHKDEEKIKAAVIPIFVRSINITGLLIVHNLGRNFQFKKFDWNLLYQLNYYTESVVSNYLMMAEISHKREEHRDLSRRLISIQEDERKRLAGDIHDTLVQALTGIGYKALLCQELIERGPERLNDELNQLLNNVNDALNQSRQIIQELRPQILDDLGVLAALKKVLADFEKQSGVTIKSTFPERLDLYPEASIALLRILQESLRNIERHARATLVEVCMTLSNGQVNLRIQDNGMGFDIVQPNSGFGLITMRERAQYLGGAFLVKARPGCGSEVCVSIPL